MLRKLGCILFVASLSASVGFAQSTFGTLLGTVTDPSGAVIANATVKVINTDEGTSRTVTTDASGDYNVVDIEAGHYSVEVSNAGFKTTRVDGLELGNPDLNITHVNNPSAGLCGFGCISSAQGLFSFAGAR